MNELYSAIDASKKWMSPLLCDGTSHAGTPCVVQDIVPFLSLQWMVRPIHTKSSFMFNPKKFLGVDEEMKVAMKAHIYAASKEAGFKLNLHKSSKDARGNRLCTLAFVCEHNAEPFELKWASDTNAMLKPGLKNVSAKKQKVVKVSKSQSRRSNMLSTARPASLMNKCQFRLSVFCDKSDKRWYLSYSSDERPGFHCGHFKMPMNSIKTPLQHISNDHKETLMSCVKANVGYAACARLVNSTNSSSVSFDKNQMKYFAANLRSSDGSLQLLKSHGTSAEKLIHFFDALIANGEQLRYVAMIHSGTHGLQIKLPKGRPTKKIGNPCKFLNYIVYAKIIQINP